MMRFHWFRNLWRRIFGVSELEAYRLLSFAQLHILAACANPRSCSPDCNCFFPFSVLDEAKQRLYEQWVSRGFMPDAWLRKHIS